MDPTIITLLIITGVVLFASGFLLGKILQEWSAIKEATRKLKAQP